MTINKKYRQFFYFCFWNLTLCASSLHFELPLHDGALSYADYGKVLSSQDVTKNGIKYKIEIYPAKNADSTEKIVRDGELVCYKDAKINVLLCHGFMGNHHDVGLMRGLFPEGSYNCMTFDFRAHGNKDRAKGQYCTLGRDEVLDIEAAVRFLQNFPETAGKRIIGIGFSMGSSSLILTEQQKKCFDGLVLDCPFDSSKDILQRALEDAHYTFLGYKFTMPGQQLLQEYVFHPYIQYMVKPLLRAFTQLDPRDISTYICPVSPKEAIKEVTIPCLFIVCKKDTRAPVFAVKSIFDNAGSRYKKLWITNGRGHCDSVFYNPEKYKEAVTEFLEAIVTNKMAQYVDQQVFEDPQEV